MIKCVWVTLTKDACCPWSSSIECPLFTEMRVEDKTLLLINLTFSYVLWWLPHCEAIHQSHHYRHWIYQWLCISLIRRGKWQRICPLLKLVKALLRRLCLIESGYPCHPLASSGETYHIFRTKDKTENTEEKTLEKKRCQTNDDDLKLWDTVHTFWWKREIHSHCIHTDCSLRCVKEDIKDNLWDDEDERNKKEENK